MNKRLLKDAQKYLDNQYLTVFLDKCILAVIKGEQDENPFLLVTCDPEVFQGFILSFSLDYPKVHEAIDIVLNLQDLAPVVLEEQFILNKAGMLLFGEEAETYNNPLSSMEVVNKQIH